jgi:hypothetical protein
LVATAGRFGGNIRKRNPTTLHTCAYADACVDLSVGGFAVNESAGDGFALTEMLTRQTTAYCTTTYAHANLALLLGTVFAARASSRSARVSSRSGDTLRMRNLSRRRSEKRLDDDHDDQQGFESANSMIGLVFFVSLLPDVTIVFLFCSIIPFPTPTIPFSQLTPSCQHTQSAQRDLNTWQQ